MVGKRRPRKRLIACLLASVIIVIPSCSGGHGAGSSKDDRTITVGAPPGYADDQAINALWKYKLKQKGWQLKTKKVSLAPIFTSVAKGDLDGYLDVWLPTTHGAYIKKTKGKLKLLKPGWNKQAKLGLAVPKYSDIRTLSDLRSHAHQFDGKIIGIESGAGEMGVLEKTVMPDYNLDKDFSLKSSSTSAMLNILKQQMSKKNPVVVALWKPHWAWSKFNIRFLRDPKHAWPPPEHVHIALSKKFAKAHPKVTGWFKNTKLNAKQWNSLMLELEKHKGHSDKGVRAWLKKPGNRDAVDGWTS